MGERGVNGEGQKDADELNTDVWRRVFFSAVTATDFQEAFDNIRKLKVRKLFG